MELRAYIASDKDRCITLFKSNCPKFFAPEELDPFILWLDHQNQGTPTYSNSEKECYYVLALPNVGVIGCGGFYMVKDENRAQLAWGMVHADFHKMAYGTALYKYRQEQIHKLKPDCNITLGTSQYSYSFFEKMGYKIDTIVEFGYGKEIHRYDMHKE